MGRYRSPRRAEWVIDLGPGAGHDGGRIVFEGPPSALVSAGGSLTGEHLRRRLADSRVPSSIAGG